MAVLNFGAAIAGACASPLLQTPDSGGVELANLYDTVVETIEKKFYDPTLLQRIDWRTRADALRPSVLAAHSTEEAVRQINGLLSELKTSHTELLTPDEYDYYALLDIVGAGSDGADLLARRFWGNLYYPGIGIFTRQVGEHHFVEGILEGSPADKAGLKYGDEILSVDGQSYSPIAAFRGRVGATIGIEIRRHAEAASQRLDVSVIPIRPTAVFTNATAASARIIERGGRRIGYVHVWASHESSGFMSALAELDPARRSSIQTSSVNGFRIGLPGGHVGGNSETDGSRPVDELIVDMRGRVGGNVGVAKTLLEAMNPEARDYFGAWRTFSRTSPNPGAAASPVQFRGHSALLINEHTRSAAEIMAFGYKRNAFGPIVGTRSAGAVSSGQLFVMPSDMLLYVAVVGMTFDNQRLEGAGVTPDYRVEQPLPYAAGADPVLDAATDLLAKQAPK